jgi:hypothetical protein
LRSLVEENEEVTTQLRSFSAILRVASSDGDGTWPEVGFAVCLQRRMRERWEVGSLGFPRRRTTSYRHCRAAALILARRVTPARHRAASPDSEAEDDGLPGGSRQSALTEPVSWPGPKWAGFLGRGGGLRQVTLLSYFFCLCFFFLFTGFNSSI